jgi:hypothetical protein
MAKRERKGSPYSATEVVKLFCAYNRGVKGVPSELVARRPFEWSYKDNTLYFRKEGQPTKTVRVARQATLNGKRVMLLNDEQAWIAIKNGSDGYARAVRDVLGQHVAGRNGQIVNTPDHTFRYSLKKLREKFWNGYVQASHIRECEKLAKLFNIPFDKVTKVPPIPGESKFFRQHPSKHERERSKLAAKKRLQVTDAEAVKLLTFYTPEEVEKRRKAKIELEFRNSARSRTNQVVSRYTNEAWHHEREADRLRRSVPEATDAQMFEHYGHKPTDDEWFKRLYHEDRDGKLVRKARHGKWPDMDQWTPEVSNPHICRQGWHVTDAKHLCDWYDWGPHVYKVEVGGANGGKDTAKACFGKAKLVKYIGDFSDEKRREVASKLADDKAQAEKLYAAERGISQAKVMAAMAQQGYDACMPDFNYATEQFHYIRRLMDQSIPLNK